MALTLVTGARDAACNAITGQIAVGSGTAYLVVGTAAMAATLFQNAFNATPFGASSTGIATANAIVDATATGAGTAAAAKIINKNGADVITGLTVSTSAANVNLTNTTIAINDVISITSMTITMPAY
jgi:hypothetical protein